MMVSVHGVDLYCRVSGAGAPLLLLHGNGEDHHIFDALADKLAQHFTLYAVDSRNHGQSSMTQDYTYDTMAQDMFGLIQALALGTVFVVGFSDGAILALLLALRYPGSVAKMALLGANLSPEDFTEESYEFIRQTYEETGDPLFRMMLEQPQIPLTEVAAVTIPALVIGGENDIFKPESFCRLAQALPAGQLQIMPGHEHDSYIVGQDLLCGDLLAFFGQEQITYNKA